MEGRTYYKIKTSNGFSDTQYKTLEEAMEIYSQYREEDRSTIEVIQTMEFQEKLEVEDSFSEGLLKPEDIHRFNGEIQDRLTYCIENYSDCKKEEEELEKKDQDYEDLIQYWQKNYAEVAEYTVQLEKRGLWEFLKDKFSEKPKPDFGLDLFRK
jgi:hypothetical protein